ncbi:sulfotransferase family protein [Erythrobacter sanguineus]|uniref:Sulfotransferase family protein n=1 Tax=Erythrobacter sanguineus TaxID=198312 RepID=A0A1M7S373_9SPHN|nr:sulfotransferase [Erythrobacter sanguineus]SHN52881.1 Sulfotransferase family protein [Erythrobacter sanguineus]
MAPARDHLLARGPLAQRANDFLGKAWDKGWLPPPNLDPDALWALAAKPYGAKAEAAEQGGRSAEDVADFRERLTRLVAAAHAEADLNPLGTAMAWGQLSRVVKNRLAFGALWADRPALPATPLPAPIIVIGHMRSGTTRIHKLLAADPAHSHTRYCDAYHPVPARFGMNRLVSKVELAMLGAINPWMQSIHPMAPSGVEEELAWLSAALHHSIFESQWHIPAYSAWSEGQDPAPVYREMLRILRTDAAHRGIADRPRVLKVPAFAEDLATLLALLPGARLVLAQREPEAVLRSAVSLAANQMAIQSDACDLGQIAARWRHKIALREERITGALAGWQGPIARLTFDELNADWEGAMARCYADLGMMLSADALIAMHKVMAASAEGHHHAHAAQLARFAEAE